MNAYLHRRLYEVKLRNISDEVSKSPQMYAYGRLVIRLASIVANSDLINNIDESFICYTL